MSQLRAAVRLLGPRIPLIVKTVLGHLLSLSETSSKWDLKSAVVVNVIRSIMCESTSSISRAQAFSLKDPGAKGEMWVARTTLDTPAADDDVRQLLFRVIDEMNVTGNESWSKPELKPVEGEWNGYRAGVGKDSPEPQMREEEKYRSLMKETSSQATILYFHGGAYYLMDPSTHRTLTSKLAKVSGGRAFSVRYRLAPQNPFPCALLDALLAYLSLLYPPPDALHDPVKAEHIVFAGDSAGGNLSFALLLVLLHLQKSTVDIRFRGHHITSIPLPAGVAVTSPWVDVTRSMPSLTSNFKYDYLPPSFAIALDSDQPGAPAQAHPSRGPPPCAAWPSPPPRADLYVEGSAMCHPLVSPLAASKEDWRGCPPVWISCGEEMLGDEIRALATTMHAAGASVRWVGYEAMPHCFAMLLPWLKVSEQSLTEYGGWIKSLVEKGSADSGAAWTAVPSGKQSEVGWNELSKLTDEQIKMLMDRERERRIHVWEEAVRNTKETAKL